MTTPQITVPRLSIAPLMEALRENLATTPGRLQAALAAIIVSALLFWIVASYGIASTQHTVQTVGKDSVPSILAAEEIRANLADMNANAANAFLGVGNQVAAANQQYETDRQTVADRLVTAAQNITYGDEERVPIKTMVDQIQAYTGLVETARSQGNQAGIPKLLQANYLMHQTLIPAAEALDKANFTHLDSAYTQSHVDGSVVQALLVGSCILLLALLAGTQFFLSTHFHRTFNVPLAAATVLLLLYCGFLVTTISQQALRMKSAKEDAFDSVHALWKARAVAFDANGDESLYLLDKPHAAQYEASFRQKSALLANAPITADVISNALNGVVNFKGYFGDELSNITFPGERDAAVSALRTYGQYMDIDKQIRSLEQSGAHQKAVDLCIGSQQGQSNWAFDQFNTALGGTIAINQKEFDKDISEAFAALSLLPIVTPLVAVVIAILAWFGLQPRIQEYNL